MRNAALRGKQCAGNPYVRFDEGEVASGNPRRGSLLYRCFNSKVQKARVMALAVMGLTLVTLADGDMRYVGVNGVDDDAHGASADAPWATIEYAVGKMTSGGTLNVGSGTYTLGSQVTVGAALTIKGAGTNDTHVTFAGSDFAFNLTSTSSVLEDLTITNCPKSAVYMAQGTVRGCRITGCTAKSVENGGCITAVGSSLIEKSSFDHNVGGRGIALCLSGSAVVKDCDISTSSRKSGFTVGSPVALLGSAKAYRCRIHHNAGYNEAGGLFLVNNSLAVNCLIYENTASSGAGGVSLLGGKMYGCTIYGNVRSGDSTGVSGVSQTDTATTRNCIIWGNGTASVGSAYVTAGTFSNNLLDKAISRGSDNFVGDPLFVNAEGADFRIMLGSAAIDRGATLTDTNPDYQGNSRPQGAAYDIGAFEFDPSTGPLSCAISVLTAEEREGAEVRVAAIVAGEDRDGVEYEWTVDGDETVVSTDQTLVLTTLKAGYHSFALKVRNAAGEKASTTLQDAVKIVGLNAFVSAHGSNVYPYDSWATAAHSLSDGWGAMYKGAGATGTLHIGEGTYDISDLMEQSVGVSIIGSGRDKTILSGANLGAVSPFALNHSAAVLSDLTITGVTNSILGGAVRASAGTVRNCRICYCKGGAGNNDGGGAIYISGSAKVIGCQIDHNYGNGGGGAVNMRGGVLCDSTLEYNSGSVIGGAVMLYQKDSLMSNCVVRANTSQTAIWAVSPCYMRNCLVADNGSGALTGAGYFYNCLMAGNGGSPAVTLSGSGSLVNCTIAGNKSTQVSLTSFPVYNSIIWGTISGTPTAIRNSCFMTATEGENGNTNKDPSFRNGYHISASTPCHNGGDISYLPNARTTTDLDGRKRVYGGQIDMGCYEVVPGMVILFN